MDGQVTTLSGKARNYSARRARKDTTRRKLVAVAIALIRKEGYQRLSVDEIARRAGTNRTTFYLHFRNKADLVQDIAEQVRDDAQAALDNLQLAGMTVASVEAWIEAVEGIYLHHSELIDAMQSALSANRESAAVFDSIAGSYLRRLTGELQPATRAQAESRLLAAYLLVERYMFYRVIRGYSLGGDSMRADLAGIVFDILRGHTAG